MSHRYPKRVWLLRHHRDPATRSPEVIRSPESAAEYAKSPDWQVVEYQLVEGQSVPKRSGA